MNQLISLLLIIVIWCALFAAYGLWEHIRARRKRSRFNAQLMRYRANG